MSLLGNVEMECVNVNQSKGVTSSTLTSEIVGVSLQMETDNQVYVVGEKYLLDLSHNVTSEKQVEG